MTIESSAPILISIIIPVYNDQAGLNKCLKALENQTFPANSFEIIVVDNGSDNPVETSVVPQLNTRTINCLTKGSYAARNTGIKQAKGGVVAFTDADCTPTPTWLEHGFKALTEHPEKTIIGGEVNLVASDQPTLVEQYQCLTGFGQKNNIESKRFTVTANLFVKRTDINRIGFFEEELLSGGDREWSWRAEQEGYHIAYDKDVIVDTPPRRSLKSAITQARRVSGGRYHFKQLGLTNNPLIEQRLAPQRGSWDAITWILKQQKFSMISRIKILCVASLLKLVHIIETVRLQFGSNPERC